MFRKKFMFLSISLLMLSVWGRALVQIRTDLMDVEVFQPTTFSSIPDPILNPMMGWAPWASTSQIKQPHTLVYADLTWREFEPQPGVYDFATFENENQFKRWRAENKRLIFRFVLDKPGDVAHKDIPDWLYTATGGDGDIYNNSYGMGFSPNYANAQLIQYHKNVIKALASRYAKDDFIAFIELGSLGHWGEWHVNYKSGIRRLPLANIRDQYIAHYVEAFPNTLLLMRRPFAAADQYGLGLFNDMTGCLDSTEYWLDWIANGGDFYETGEKNALSPMPNAWQTAPIGGEQTSDFSLEELYGTNLSQTIRLVQASHTTFIGPNGPYKQPVGGPLQSGIDQVLASIGYRIYIQRVSMPSLNDVGTTTLPVTITFANDGVAPLYANWPAKVYLFDASGQVRKTIQPNMDVRKILPGAPYSVSMQLSLTGLEKGTYTLGFAIIDPHTNLPAVRLAMANPRQDLIQAVSGFTILDFSDIVKLFLPITRSQD